MASGAATKDPRKVQYHEHHPMRVDGIMPHDLPKDGWIEYQILQQMTEEGYWMSVVNGQEQAEEWEVTGHPISTASLTDDQKGWAKADHWDHYQKETARWLPVPGKSSKVTPAKLAFQIRDRIYQPVCECGEEAKLVLWGYRWDLRPLHQCHRCGEVIVKPPRVYGPQPLTDDNDDKEHDDNEAND